MGRKPTISLADDRRARVPFALIAVALLTTSIVSVSMINQRSTPEVDISPDLVHDRMTMAAESAISDAVSDAIAEAGQQPVTDPSDDAIKDGFMADFTHDDWEPQLPESITPYGQPWADDIPVDPTNAMANGQRLTGYEPDSDAFFRDYVKLRIYVKINQRLEETTQSISGPNGEAYGHAELPPLSKDSETIAAALDRITLEIGGDGSDLDKGEYRITVDEVQQTVTVGGQEIHREEQSYTVGGETAIFEMHSQMSDYQELLDSEIEPLLYAYIYPLFFAKAMLENRMGTMIEAFAYQQLIHHQELIVFTNRINYNMQHQAFGTTDQSYPSMMDLGGACLAHVLAGNLIGGIGLRQLTKKGPLWELFPMTYPADSFCYYTMYAETPQATTTATTDIPPVADFARDDVGDWESRGDGYNHISGSAERVSSFEVDPSSLNTDEFSDDELSAVRNTIDTQTLDSEQQIEIDPIANQVYIEMFGLDDDHFENSAADPSDEEVDDALDQANVDIGDGDLGVDAREAEQEDINRLREQLIEDIEPLNVTPIQMMSSEDIYGDLITQIKQREDEYIYAETDVDTVVSPYPRSPYGIYGLRNAYIRHVIDSLESAEEGRQETVDRIDREFGELSLEESLILGQAALEGEATNLERIEEIADNARRESETDETAGIDKADRTSYVWWSTPDIPGRYDAARYSTFRVDDLGYSIPQTFDSNGVPERVTPNMIFAFTEGRLPESYDEITTTKISGARYADGVGIYPGELDGSSEDHHHWHIRAIDLERDIYRITNAELINRGWGGDRGAGDTYVQLHRINEDMNLSDSARWYLGDDMFTLTMLDIPPEPDEPEDTSEGIDKDPEELAPPELRVADKEDFEFEVHASPGYLSGLPITREIEPSIRPPGTDPTDPRNSLFTPMSVKTLNPLPNPGFPIIIPIPPRFFWILSVNYWKTDVKAEYARFELRSETSNGLDTGPENYVRQDMTVNLNIDGSPTRVGAVEPISLEATNHFPMVAPGRYTSKILYGRDKTSGEVDGSWGTGNSLNLGSSAMTPGFPITWSPEKCTPGWPDVGPGVDPKGIGRDCADLGPVGEAIGSRPINQFLRGSILIHASLTGEPQTEEAARKVGKLCVEGKGCEDVDPR